MARTKNYETPTVADGAVMAQSTTTHKVTSETVTFSAPNFPTYAAAESWINATAGNTQFALGALNARLAQSPRQAAANGKTEAMIRLENLQEKLTAAVSSGDKAAAKAILAEMSSDL